MLKFIKRLISAVLILALCSAALLAFLGYRESRTALAEKPLDSAVAEIRAKEHFTSLSDLPEIYTDAVVAVEDHRFRMHFGIDPLGIARAIIVNIRGGELKEGGSTITQQLIKNIYFPENRDIIKKVAEAILAVKLENNYSKDDILELYVNNIYFGDGYYCVYDASMGYFDKTPDKMNAYESTLLAGIPNAPSVYSPTKNPDLAEQRRQTVLKKMKAEGYDTGEE